MTTELFWDCECDDRFIHSQQEDTCNVCGAKRKDCADARPKEVLANADKFGLDERLVRKVRQQEIIRELGY